MVLVLVGTDSVLRFANRDDNGGNRMLDDPIPRDDGTDTRKVFAGADVGPQGARADQEINNINSVNKLSVNAVNMC